MNVKHTPGPWKERMEHLDKNVFGKERVVRLIVTEEPTWETICEMRWDAQEESFGHMIANARLIAAAPDLLEACEAAMETMEKWNDGNPIAWDGAFDMIDNAIKKAKGE